MKESRLYCLQPVKWSKNPLDSAPLSLFSAIRPVVHWNPYVIDSCRLAPLLRKNVLDYVSQFHERLHHANSLAKQSLSDSQTAMKKLLLMSLQWCAWNTVLEHDIDVKDARPNNMRTTFNPVKCALMKKETFAVWLSHALQSLEFPLSLRDKVWFPSFYHRFP